MFDIDLIAGARPNFIKISAIFHALETYNSDAQEPINFRLVHTGQHFDQNMSGDFFDQLKIPCPHVNFAVQGGSQATQKAKIMTRYEQLLENEPVKICVVVGDVNSTAACSIAAAKLGVKVAHVEAGIRSFDRTMPEEINRLLTDSISDIFFTTSRSAGRNLQDSGILGHQIHFVGNTMIDTLLRFKSQFKIPQELRSYTDTNRFVVLTMHRPNNVDTEAEFTEMLEFICSKVPQDYKIIFPVHPRSRKFLNTKLEKSNNLVCTKPQSYFAFLGLLQDSQGIITDSGGVTEEATVLKIPCITLRDSTERPETVGVGTNILVGKDSRLIEKNIDLMCTGRWKNSEIPELWDGLSGDRIVAQLAKELIQ